MFSCHQKGGTQKFHALKILQSCNQVHSTHDVYIQHSIYDTTTEVKLWTLWISSLQISLYWLSWPTSVDSPTVSGSTKIRNPNPMVNLLQEMEKIQTSSFCSDLFNFPSNFPLQRNCFEILNVQLFNFGVHSVGVKKRKKELKEFCYSYFLQITFT